jgi:hypothetical protein
MKTAKKILSGALWLGRGTATVMGLALFLALTVGLASTALAGTGVGARLDLGKTNTVNALTTLVGSVAGPSLKIDNNSTNGSATALSLRVEAGKAPMKVNSGARVANLNADEVDGEGFACPGGTLFHEGVCIETTRRGPDITNSAERDCLDEGRRLPTVAELQTFRNRAGHDFGGASPFEPSEARVLGADNQTFRLMVPADTGFPFFALSGAQNSFYRCVAQTN